MKRLFIAINLPNEVKEKLKNIMAGISDFCRVPPENWHLTLVFLGYQPDEAIIPILESIKKAAQSFTAPNIEFEKIIYGPSNRPARMIWLTGSKETSQILGKIKNKLEDDLIANRVRFKIENRPYNSHMTLMRFSGNPPTLPSKPIDNLLNFTSQSIDLMEAYLKRSGAEYDILTKVDFNK